MTVARNQRSLRQSMAWLHTWVGLASCWVLFAIFLTGTICVFEEPITRWMKPERARRLGRVETIDPAAAVRFAQRYLARTAPRSDFWSIGLSDAVGPDMRIYWDENGARRGARLDAVTGGRLPPAADCSTEGGYHFVTMHLDLHAGIVGSWIVGSWIVGVFAVGFLTALVSEILVHARVFKDYFTFRPGKGQRSWLNGHNAVGVLALPFQFMIAYTGLTLVYWLYMPAAISAGYPSQGAYFSALLDEPPHREQTHIAAPVTALDRLARTAHVRLGRPISSVYVEHPGDSSATAEYDRLAPSRAVMRFSAVSGRVLDVRLADTPRGGAVQDIQDVLSALYMATFGGVTIKWLYFICGLAGTATTGSGAMLFMVKRRHKALNEFGAGTTHVCNLIEALNVAATAGLAIASIGYFWANRLIPVALEQRSTWEVRAFFVLWLLTLLHAACRPRRRAWTEQFGTLAALCMMLPILNAATTGDQIIAQILRKDWSSAGAELVALATGIVAFRAAVSAHRRTGRAPEIRNASAHLALRRASEA